jgi:hypothetical protein
MALLLFYFPFDPQVSQCRRRAAIAIRFRRTVNNERFSLAARISFVFKTKAWRGCRGNYSNASSFTRGFALSVSSMDAISSGEKRGNRDG